MIPEDDEILNPHKYCNGVYKECWVANVCIKADECQFNNRD